MRKWRIEDYEEIYKINDVYYKHIRENENRNEIV